MTTKNMSLNTISGLDVKNNPKLKNQVDERAYESVPVPIKPGREQSSAFSP
jgi:hypothetical protein